MTPGRKYAIIFEVINPFSAKQRPYHRICNEISSFGTKRVNINKLFYLTLPL